uniref:HMA domain-containing protein n=1 Tax=Ananas comosus var. bracteatus TaxID=296719 RepID=A0A6V7P176_ANACO|nr:unnamed protein product [Ananas comosus var. bracteatus]
MAIKQKMEIKVQVECKCVRQQAMKIASLIDGVENVGVEGDKLVITGTGIYWVRLLKLLEKKLGCIQLLTLAEVKPKEPPKPPQKPRRLLARIHARIHLLAGIRLLARIHLLYVLWLIPLARPHVRILAHYVSNGD